jgi:uridine kinase
MMIGVCGGSGSGKTTLARRLVDELGHDNAICISFDSYYRDHSHMTVEERAKVNFDHPDSLDVPLLVEHLAALSDGREVAVPVYDFATHTRSGDIDIVQPHKFVIIEGILLFAFEEVRDRLDYMIFRDCPTDVRAARRFKRDVQERGRTPESVRVQWATTVQPMHEVFVEPFAAHADLVTTHGLDLDDVVGDIAESLRQGGPLRLRHH